jgi:enoyl-CoA hydratase/carnithine racemase
VSHGAEHRYAGEFVRLEVEDGLGTIRLDRPPMNPLSVQVQEEIRAAAQAAGVAPDVAAVVVYGGEKVFAAGADIKEMQAMSYVDMVERSVPLQSSISAVAQIRKPTVAAVTGYALGGGCELALACDFRVVGPARAKDIVFSGRFVGAEEALRIGLVDKVVPADEVYATALAWMRSFVGGPAYALRAAKEAVDRGIEADLDTGLEIERMLFAGLFATKDRTTGMTSFVEHGPGKATFEGA